MESLRGDTVDYTDTTDTDGESLCIVTKAMTTHDYNASLMAVVDFDFILTLGVSSGGIVAVAERRGENIDIKFRYIIYDFYDWDPTNTESVIPLIKPDSEVYKLHHAGWARHFMIYGEKEYEVEVEK